MKKTARDFEIVKWKKKKNGNHYKIIKSEKKSGAECGEIATFLKKPYRNLLKKKSKRHFIIFYKL